MLTLFYFPGASVSFTNYNNIGDMMSDTEHGDIIRSSVLAVNILHSDEDDNRTHLDKPVTMTLNHSALHHDSRRQCSYWSFTDYNWQSDGCAVDADLSTATQTVCQVTT